MAGSPTPLSVGSTEPSKTIEGEGVAVSARAVADKLAVEEWGKCATGRRMHVCAVVVVVRR